MPTNNHSIQKKQSINYKRDISRNNPNLKKLEELVKDYVNEDNDLGLVISTKPIKKDITILNSA